VRVRPLLHHLAVVDHRDGVRVAHRGQPVRHQYLANRKPNSSRSNSVLQCQAATVSELQHHATTVPESRCTVQPPTATVSTPLPALQYHRPIRELDPLCPFLGCLQVYPSIYTTPMGPWIHVTCLLHHRIKLTPNQGLRSSKLVFLCMFTCWKVVEVDGHTRVVDQPPLWPVGSPTLV
jgi:hypothetical protein